MINNNELLWKNIYNYVLLSIIDVVESLLWKQWPLCHVISALRYASMSKMDIKAKFEEMSFI